MAEVEIEKSGRIAIVRFDRGQRANALSFGTMRALTDAADALSRDTALNAIILMGRADNFCMGFDLKDMETAALQRQPLADRRLALQTGGRMCAAWAALEPLTISAIEGWCVGGGVALAVSTDIRVMGAGAQVYVPEVERGMNMSWGSVPRIVNLVGPAKAKRLVMLGEKLSAARAVDWGFADEAGTDALGLAKAYAARAAEMPPVALRMIKRSIDAYASAFANLATHADFDQFALTQTGTDYEEGIASFLEGRAPRFTGA